MVIFSLKAWSFYHQNERSWSNLSSLINLQLEMSSWVSTKGNCKCNVGAVLTFVSCEIWSSHRSIPEDSGHLRCDAVFAQWHSITTWQYLSVHTLNDSWPSTGDFWWEITNNCIYWYMCLLYYNQRSLLSVAAIFGEVISEGTYILQI